MPEQAGDVEVPGTGDATRARVARRDQLTGVLVGPPHVEQHEARLVETLDELGER